MDNMDSKENELHIEYGIWSNTKYIIRTIKKYRPVLMIVMFLAMATGSVLSFLWGVLGKFIIDLSENNKTLDGNTESLLAILFISGMTLLIINTIDDMARLHMWHMQIFVRFRVITERIAKALSIPYEKLEQPDVLDMEERARNATESTSDGFQGMIDLIYVLGKNAFTVIITVTAGFIVDYRLILFLAILAAIQYFYYLRVIKKDKEVVWDRLIPFWRQRSYMQRVTQDFEFAKEVRLFKMDSLLLNKQEEVYEGIEDRRDCHQIIWLKYGQLGNIASVLGNLMIYVVLIRMVLKDQLEIGNFTLFFALATSFSGALMNTLQIFGDLKRFSLKVDDLRSFLGIKYDEDGDKIPIPDEEEFEIEFHNVTYKYANGNKEALSKLNFKINAGEKIAVVGINGAGKTTMIKLLLRLYDPTEGYITLNGVDICKYDRVEYYKLFAPVFQDVQIFAYPVAENVAMKSSAEIDEKRTVVAIEEAGMDKWLASLDKDIHTELLKYVDDKGVNLSGGEKQKLALARALYKEAHIVVLDEPTSALDAIAEQRLYENFDKMIGNKTAIFISHRLASNKFCDRIVVFKNGVIIESGSHEELMKKNEEYANMFNMQAQYYFDNADCSLQENGEDFVNGTE